MVDGLGGLVQNLLLFLADLLVGDAWFNVQDLLQHDVDFGHRLARRVLDQDMLFEDGHQLLWGVGGQLETVATTKRQGKVFDVSALWMGRLGIVHQLPEVDAKTPHIAGLAEDLV